MKMYTVVMIKIGGPIIQAEVLVDDCDSEEEEKQSASDLALDTGTIDLIGLGCKSPRKAGYQVKLCRFERKLSSGVRSYIYGGGAFYRDPSVP